MKRSSLTKAIGASVAVAGMAVLPLSFSAPAQAEVLSQANPGMQNQQMMQPGMQNQQMMQMQQGGNTQRMSAVGVVSPQALQNRWRTAREMYRLGRHEWRGEGMMSPVRSGRELTALTTIEITPLVPATQMQPGMQNQQMMQPGMQNPQNTIVPQRMEGQSPATPGMQMAPGQMR